VWAVLAGRSRWAFARQGLFRHPLTRERHRPIPESPIDCGLPEALLFKRRVAVRLPAAVGVKLNVTLQALNVASVPEQELLLIRKSPGFAPLSEAAIKVAGWVRPL
jgi:hypothetical protein